MCSSDLKPPLFLANLTAIEHSKLVSLQLAVKLAKKSGGLVKMKHKYASRQNSFSMSDLGAAIQVLEEHGYKDQIVIIHSKSRGWYFEHINSDNLNNVIDSIAVVMNLKHTPHHDLSTNMAALLRNNPNIDILLTVEDQ